MSQDNTRNAHGRTPQTGRFRMDERVESVASGHRSQHIREELPDAHALQEHQDRDLRQPHIQELDPAVQEVRGLPLLWLRYPGDSDGAAPTHPQDLYSVGILVKPLGPGRLGDSGTFVTFMLCDLHR